MEVVLKVVRQPNDEWHSGGITAAFEGRGVVRVLESIEGAALFERVMPGTALVDTVLAGRDDDATEILADVIWAMSGAPDSQVSAPNAAKWGQSFERYLATGDRQVPRELVERAQEVYLRLARSQGETRLLHGDLQHYNVLLDVSRGWLAIDPKGVTGETEYELGASLRNPGERPDLFASAKIVERRLELYARRLEIDVERALGWAFAQAVLSAVWSVEDGEAVAPDSSTFMLANVIAPMLTET